MISKDDIMQALSKVKGLDLAAVSGVQITQSGGVVFIIEVDPAQAKAMEAVRKKAEKTVAKLKGVTKANAILTAEKPKAPPPTHPDPHGMNKNPRLDLPVKYIIAVASGKGGVGKSTVAVNMARALFKLGHTVGLLDADIYGPSAPRLMGVDGQKAQMNAAKRLLPVESEGLKLMSMGFLVDKDAPMVWRGPMAQTAFYQMMRDVDWADGNKLLDFLVIDMPPGTGDIQLTLAQKVNVAGAVIVSTPQDIALIDARKAVEMFGKVNVPILGIVENMSYYACPECGHEDHIFGHGGAQEEAKKRGVPFLGEVPLNATIRIASDAGGVPAIGGDNFTAIAQAVVKNLDHKADDDVPGRPKVRANQI